ncbi:MAG TPA: RtcB family protein [Anaerovoracaceae bacterium]|nr:RtcB family protein [Anaerovoracaceae bacterium]
MIELKGKYNTAKVFTDNLDDSAAMQIVNLLNQEFVGGSKIRIMPDAHAGAGCTIGTTMTITDKVVPNLVGVDIGCGMETVVLNEKNVNLDRLDKIIHTGIPAGFAIRKKPHKILEKIDLKKLRIANKVNLNRAERSLGTLGGGNHFIELGSDEEGNLYLVVHSGSRNLGKQVAENYQRTAVGDLAKKIKESEVRVAHLRKDGHEYDEIKKELGSISLRKVERSLAFTEGTLFEDYLHDMAIVQHYATLNRKAIVEEIIRKMELTERRRFTTIHNYIDLKSMILRKGAISAKEGEEVLIPINMRDGSLICIGKGNPDWNCSAPHGAGRILSRRAAKENISLKEFKKSMEGIYSSTVNKRTLDEAPFAYKPIEEIISNIGETVEISKRIKPLYNFKATE